MKWSALGLSAHGKVEKIDYTPSRSLGFLPMKEKMKTPETDSFILMVRKFLSPGAWEKMSDQEKKMLRQLSLSQKTFKIAARKMAEKEKVAA